MRKTRVDWSAPVSDGEAAQRAGGRRHYNSVRQFRAAMRRQKLGRLLLQGHTQASAARVLGVSESTISRDVAYMDALWREGRTCPICGRTGLLFTGADGDGGCGGAA